MNVWQKTISVKTFVFLMQCLKTRGKICKKEMDVFVNNSRYDNAMQYIYDRYYVISVQNSNQSFYYFAESIIFTHFSVSNNFTHFLHQLF